MEKDWRELFSVQEIPEPYRGLPTESGECTANCQLAKEIKCVCRFGGTNHGAALKKHVQPLDQFNEPRELELEVTAK
jgi:hypothetical protein